MATQGHFSTYNSDPLGRALGAMRIEPEGAALTFAAKLARDNGWDRPFAEAVAQEYRRFLYLAATAQTPVTPSDAVDRAWHLHLTYSRHYWDVLCGQILGRPLHHDPSLGGAGEDARHRDQYAGTLARYRETFGEEPPAAIWPGGMPAPKRARRLAALTGGAAATMLLAACAAAASTGERSSGDNQLIGWIAIGLVFLVIVVVSARRKRKGPGRRTGSAAGGDGGSSCGSTSSDSDSGGSDGGGSSCGGGCGGGGD
jgi:hypothetical protein